MAAPLSDPSPDVSPRADCSLDDWWAGGERVTFSIGGVDRQIFVRVDGPADAATTAPTITFVHGYPSSSFDWVPVLSRLRGGFRTICFDLLGFGASDKPRAHAFSIAEQAEVTGAVWDALGVTDTVLVCHDYGDTVGQELLARAAEGRGPTLTSSLWLNGGIYPEQHRPTDGQKALLDDDGGAELAAAMDLAMFSYGFSLVFGPDTKPTEAELAEQWRAVSRDDGHELLHDLLHYIAERRVHRARWVGALETVQPPPRFVWGMVDPVSGGHMLEPARAGRPDLDVIELATIGHYPQLEAPAAVAAAILDLVAR